MPGKRPKATIEQERYRTMLQLVGAAITPGAALDHFAAQHAVSNRSARRWYERVVAELKAEMETADRVSLTLECYAGYKAILSNPSATTGERLQALDGMRGILRA